MSEGSSRREAYTEDSAVRRRFAGSALAGVVALLLAAAPALAQQGGQVTGRVMNQATGESLSGVQMTVQGTGLGGLTNADGRYVIQEVPAGSYTLQARLIGFGTQTRQIEVEAGATATVNFQLSRSAVEMEQIVVTGQAGRTRKKELGNDVATISAESIEDLPAPTMSGLLQGQTAGMQVLQNSGQPGAASTIRLRGVNTLSGGASGNRPLIYVDGVRLTRSNPDGDPEVNQTTSALGSINPTNIDRIEVVRGPAATTLYGAEASAGVIQIFTKQGAEGSARWNFEIQQGFTRYGHMGPEENNPTGLNFNDCSDEPGCPADGDWMDPGHQQKYSGSVSGGGGGVTYFLSGDYGNNEGYIALEDEGQVEWSARGNFGFNPSDELNVRFNSQYTNRDVRWIPDGNNAEGLLLNVFRGDAGYVPNNNDRKVLDMDLQSHISHAIAGTNVTWTPTSGLSQQLKLGVDYFFRDYEEEKPWQFFLEPEGAREVDDWQRRTLTFDYTGTWSERFTEGISSEFTWGGQLIEKQLLNQNGFGDGFAGPGPKVLESGAQTSVFEDRTTTVTGGVFAQERIGIDDRLFVTAGLRVDGNSSFGKNYGAQFFPKLSAAYSLGELEFWPDWWSTMKLRGAVGESGNAPGPFDAVRTWQSVSGDNGQPGVSPDNPGETDLGPEVTREVETGFDAAMFEDRVTASFSYYKQWTSNGLVDVQAIPSQGFVGSQLQNVGEWTAQGFEVQVNLGVIRSDNLSWNVDVNYSKNDNEIQELAGLERIYSGWDQWFIPGQPFPVYRDEVIQNPDENAEPVYDDEVIGPSYPTHQFGVSTRLSLMQRLTLRATGDFQGGHYLNSGVAYQNARREAWPLCQEEQQAIANGNRSSLTAFQRGACDPDLVRDAQWTRPADFFKVRNVTLTYRVPQDILSSVVGPVRRATVSLGAHNLSTFTDWPGIDPEAMEDGGRDYQLSRQSYYTLPPSQRFVATVRVGF